MTSVRRSVWVAARRDAVVSARSTCGRRATAATTTTATATATRPACGPSRSTRPRTTDRRPATTRAARRHSRPPSATARADTRTPEWSVCHLSLSHLTSPFPFLPFPSVFFLPCSRLPSHRFLFLLCYPSHLLCPSLTSSFHSQSPIFFHLYLFPSPFPRRLTKIPVQGGVETSKSHIFYASISPEPRIQTSPDFVHATYGSGYWSYSDVVAIRYVL